MRSETTDPYLDSLEKLKNDLRYGKYYLEWNEVFKNKRKKRNLDNIYYLSDFYSFRDNKNSIVFSIRTYKDIKRWSGASTEGPLMTVNVLMGEIHDLFAWVNGSSFYKNSFQKIEKAKDAANLLYVEILEFLIYLEFI